MLCRFLRAAGPLAAVLLVLSACGGNGSLSPSPGPTNSLVVKLFVPTTSAAKGLLIQAYQHGGRSSVLSSKSAALTDCPTVAAGSLCTILMNAAPGTDDFVLTAYIGAQAANGHFSASQVIGTGVTWAIVPATGYVTVNAALGGAVASMVLSVSPATISAALPSSVFAQVDAHDAQNRTIITSQYTGQSGKPSTIQMAVSPAADFASSGWTLNAPAANGFTAPFNGTVAKGYEATFSATSPGISANAKVTLVPPTFQSFTAGLNADAYPYSLRGAPNGTIWFTDRGKAHGGVDAIGYLKDTPESSIHEIPVTQGSDPLEMTFDPANGSMWFTEFEGGSIDEIDPNNPTAASLHRYSLGIAPITPPTLVTAITAASDGKLWILAGNGKSETLAGSGPQEVLVFNPVTHMVEHRYPLGPAAFDPWAETFDRNGNLWIAEHLAAQVEEMNPQGKIIATIKLPRSVEFHPFLFH